MNPITDYIMGDRRDPRAVLETIFGTTAQGAGPQPEARRWAHDALAECGVDPATSAVEAIKVLRDAEPRLGLKTATFLVRNLGAQATAG